MNYSTNYHCFLAASEHIRELIRLQIEDPDGEKVKLHLIIICVRLFFIILKNSSLLSIFESKAKQCFGSVFIFYGSGSGSRIRMEANTDPDPDPIRIQGFNDQKLKKITAEQFFLFFFDQKLQFTYP